MLVPLTSQAVAQSKSLWYCSFDFGHYTSPQVPILKYRAHGSCRKQDTMILFSRNKECVT